MDCHCGAIPMAVIERVLLDPRNRSASYWRERLADQLVLALSQSQEDFEDEEAAAKLSRAGGPWSRELELLDRDLTPSNLHESARLRVSQLPQVAGGSAPKSDLEVLRMKVVDALDWGGALSCPKCGMRAIKDDACVHMTCACTPGYGQWCFLCGKESGPAREGKCPMGEGGCDEPPGGAFLEHHDGWGDFALPGEAKSFGAQKEFLRRRQAYLVRLCKEGAEPELWNRLRAQHSAMMQNVPTDGRSIDWDALDAAEFPLFGKNARDGIDPRELIGAVDTIVGADDMERRLQVMYLRRNGAVGYVRNVAAPPHNWQAMWERCRRQPQIKAVYPAAITTVVLLGILLTEFAISSAGIQADLTCIHDAPQTINIVGDATNVMTRDESGVYPDRDNTIALCDTDVNTIDSQYANKEGLADGLGRPMDHQCKSETERPVLSAGLWWGSWGTNMGCILWDTCDVLVKKSTVRVIPASQCVAQKCPVDYDGRDVDGVGLGCTCELGLYYSRDQFGHKCVTSAAHSCAEALQTSCENSCDEICQQMTRLPVAFVLISSFFVWMTVALNIGQAAPDFRRDLRSSVVEWLVACAMIIWPYFVMTFVPHLVSSGVVAMSICFTLFVGFVGTPLIAFISVKDCLNALAQRFPCLERPCLECLSSKLLIFAIYLTYIGFSIIALIALADPLTGGYEQVPTVFFECGWVCSWFDTFRRGVDALFAVALAGDYLLNWPAEVWLVMGVDDWASARGRACSCKGLLKRLLLEPLIITLYAYSLSTVMSAWSIDIIATGWFAGVLVLTSTCSYGMMLLLSLRTIEHHLMPRRVKEFWQSWILSEVASRLSACVLLWLLWVYRSASLQRTWPDSPWAHSVRWQVVWIDLAALLVGQYIAAYDHEPPDHALHPLDGEIQSRMQNAMALTSWPLLMHSVTLDYWPVKTSAVVALSAGFGIVAYEAVCRFRGPRALRGNLAAQRRTPAYVFGSVLSLMVLVAQLTMNVQEAFALGNETRTGFLCGGIDCGPGRECSEGRCCPPGFDGSACEISLDDRGFAPAYEVTGCASAVDAIAFCDPDDPSGRCSQERALFQLVCGTYHKTDTRCDGAPVYTRSGVGGNRGPAYTFWRDSCDGMTMPDLGGDRARRVWVKDDLRRDHSFTSDCSVWRITSAPPFADGDWAFTGNNCPYWNENTEGQCTRSRTGGCGVYVDTDHHFLITDLNHKISAAPPADYFGAERDSAYCTQTPVPYAVADRSSRLRCSQLHSIRVVAVEDSSASPGGG